MKKWMLGAIVASAVSMYAGMVEVKDAYAREVPPNLTNSAAFMTLVNKSDKAIDLMSAYSDVSKIVELHTHSKVNGMMQMHKVPKITIPAKGQVQLKPGGLHVMFIGLHRPLKQGEIANVTLRFSNGESVSVNAPVKKIKGMMKPMQHGMMHQHHH